MEEIKSGIIMEVVEDYNIEELDANADVHGMEEIESGIVIEVPENLNQEDSENDFKNNLSVNLELDGATSTSSDSDAKIVISTWNHRRRTSNVRKSKVINFHLSSDEETSNEDKSSNEIIFTTENPTSTVPAEIIHDISSDDTNSEGDETSSDNANSKDDDKSSENANNKDDDTSSDNANSKIDDTSSEHASIVLVDDISSAESKYISKAKSSRKIHKSIV